MKVVADTNIPFLKGVLEPYFEVVYMDGRAIDREAMHDADAIIIRCFPFSSLVILLNQ